MELKEISAICMEILGGYKHRDIAKRHAVSASLVSRFKSSLANGGFYSGVDGCRRLSELSDAEVGRLIYPRMIDFKEGGRVVIGRPKADTYIPNFKAIADEIVDAHVSRKFCYSQYLEECEKRDLKSISRSDFYAKLTNELKKLKGQKVYMTQEHPYGFEVCIDYCGRNWIYYDGDHNLRKAPIFVMTWSASYMTFAMAVERQTTKCTCEAIGKAFQYFGYIPFTLQYDNAKNAVVSHTKGAETIFNDSFSHFMERIKVSPVTSNPRSPNEKSCVESSVFMIQNNILPAMDHDPTLPLEEVNRQMLSLVDKYVNKARFRNDSTKTREYLFKHYEIAKARKFEGRIPEFYEHIAYLKVGNDYTVKVGNTHYSVPYQYAGEYVSASISGNKIKITKDLKEIATHVISNDGSRSIKLEHMPEAHRAVAEKRLQYPDKDSIIKAAQRYSDSLVRFCECLLNKWGFENGKKGCIRIINCYKRKDTVRDFMDEAIARTLNDDPRQWNSNTVLEEYKEVQKEAVFNHGKVKHQMEINFCADPQFAHLRSHEGQPVTKPDEDGIKPTNKSETQNVTPYETQIEIQPEGRSADKSVPNDTSEAEDRNQPSPDIGQTALKGKNEDPDSVQK